MLGTLIGYEVGIFIAFKHKKELGGMAVPTMQPGEIEYEQFKSAVNFEKSENSDFDFYSYRQCRGILGITLRCSHSFGNRAFIIYEAYDG